VELPEDLTSYSIGVWIKPEQVEESVAVILVTENEVGEETRLQIRPNGSLQLDFGQVLNFKAYEGGIRFGEWNFVAMTFDENEKKARIYLNGHQSGSSNFPPQTFLKLSSLRLGGASAGTKTSLNGRIDELFIMERKMESREIRTLYFDGYPDGW